MGFWYKTGIGTLAAILLAILFLAVFPPVPEKEEYSPNENNIPEKEKTSSPLNNGNTLETTSHTGREQADPAFKNPNSEKEKDRDTSISRNSQDNSAEIKKSTAKEVQWFGNTSVPLKNRQVRLKELALKGDARSSDILKAVGDAELYVNRYAVEELGNIKTAGLHAGINQYLTTKLSSNDALLVCASVKAIGNLMGEEAVLQLADTIRNNRSRADGHEDMVCTAAVEALSKIGSEKGTAILAEELKRSNEKGWDLEYGSKVVTALANIGTPTAFREIAVYADRLAKQIPDDPMASAYYRKKIEEARKAAAQQ
ncbi:HEAT repeat domain-containing protein [Planctomycetota bacterium]